MADGIIPYGSLNKSKNADRVDYFEKQDFERYVGQMVEYLAYLLPMGTHEEGRYFEEVEELIILELTDTLLIGEVKRTGMNAEESVYYVQHMIPISQIAIFRCYMDESAIPPEKEADS